MSQMKKKHTEIVISKDDAIFWLNENGRWHNAHGEFQHKKVIFEIYKDKSEQYRFRFKAPNGEVMFQGQGYKQKQSVKSAIESIQKNAAGAEVDEQS
jgi:hypothetical protein